MDLNMEARLRDEFREILYTLAQDDLALSDPGTRSKIYQRLEKLYHTQNDGTKFRHFYSDIFMIVTTLQQEDMPGNIEILGHNLSFIRCGYQAKNKDKSGKLIDIHDSLRKLYDHVNLEIAKLNFSDGADRRLKQEDNIAQIHRDVIQLQSETNTLVYDVDSLKESVERAEKDSIKTANSLKDAQNLAKDTMHTVENMEKEYIAILGIFASIVLTFTGGISFTSSVFQNMHLVSTYRLVVTILLIGLVLMNVIYGLFYYLNKIIQKSSSEKHKLTPLFVSNAVLLCLLLGTVFAWKNGCIEERNIKIDQSKQVIIVDSPSTYPSDVTPAPG